jgi:hypothetical protein
VVAEGCCQSGCFRSVRSSSFFGPQSGCLPHSLKSSSAISSGVCHGQPYGRPDRSSKPLRPHCSYWSIHLQVNFLELL